MSRRHPLVVTALLAFALLAACGGAKPAAPRATLPPFNRGSGSELQARTMSLTGLPGDSTRTPIVVKVNNIAPGGAQLGIGKADIVAEELVEGGLTRIAPMYQSRVPSLVGPVRSLRSTDVGLVLPTHGPLVDSGGSIWETRYLRVHHVPQLFTGLQRTPDRVPPYNLFLSPHLPPKAPHPLPPYFDFGPPVGQSVPARTVTLRFSPSSATTTFTARGATWVKSPDLAADPFRPTSLLVIRVTTRVNFIDEHGAKVYESMLVGKGPATLFFRGRAYRGTWSHPSFSAPWHISTRVPVGRTAFELVPVQGSVTVTR